MMKVQRAFLFLIIILLNVLTACASTQPSAGGESFVSAQSTPQTNTAVKQSPYTAPNPRLHFARIGIDDGLSQSVVLSIAQDSRGYMWFGTEDGLNRYDGYDFKVYRPVPDDPTSLSDQWITVIYEDGQGFLWIGTRQGGLNRFDPRTETFTRFQYDPEDPNSLSSNTILTIFEDRHNRLWIGTSIGLDRLNRINDHFVHYSGNDSAAIPIYGSVTDIAEDGQGNLWLGTGGSGLWRFNVQSGEARVFRYNPGDAHSLSNNFIQAIAVEADDTLWVATRNGLNLYQPATGTFRIYRHTVGREGSMSHNIVYDLLIDRGNTLWIATQDGLDYFNREVGDFVHFRHNPDIPTSLSSNTIYTLYEDPSGLLWIGTYSGGISLYDQYQNKFAHYYYQPDNSNTLGFNVIFPLYVDAQGILWIGTYGNGLDRFDPRSGTFTHIRHDDESRSSLQSNRVLSILVDHAGTLWVGTDAGLDHLNSLTGNFTHYIYDEYRSEGLTGSTVYDLFEDQDNNLWIATNNGLGLFDPDTQTFTSFRREPGNINSLSDNAVVSIISDGVGGLWLGTFSGGLNHFDPASGRFTRYMADVQDPQSLSNNSVLSLYIDTRDILWVGTAGGGLNRFDPETGKFTIYRRQQGLSNDNIYGILEDNDGYLWLSTNLGLSRFGPLSEEFKNYTVSDGLQSNEFNRGSCAKDSSGRLYFGGVNGLTVFDPSTILENTYIPPVVLTSFSRNGQEFQTGVLPQGFNLKWPDNGFEFEFAALSYSKSEQNQYAYMLEDVDTEWYYSGPSRTGRYPNLPAGNYNLRLKAANSDGVWNEAGISIPITIGPPFWQTWWFRVMTVLLLIAVVLAGYRIRVKGIEADARELERQVSERTHEIEKLFERNKELAVVEERNRLARELHDSAKQKAFAALAQLGTANGILYRNTPAAKTHLDEAENLVYEVIQELTFLIQEIYPIALKEKGLATMLREYAYEWENRNSATIDLKIANERRMKLETEQALYRVVQESLANVARHSNATQVIIRVSYNYVTVDVSIADNGQGFDQQTRPIGMGLRSIRERVESAGGSFSIASQPGQGTELNIRVPADRSEQ